MSDISARQSGQVDSVRKTFYKRAILEFVKKLFKKKHATTEKLKEN